MLIVIILKYANVLLLDLYCYSLMMTFVVQEIIEVNCFSILNSKMYQANNYD